MRRLYWWAIPGMAYIFFVLFGTNKKVFSENTKLWTWFSTTVLRRPLPAKERSMPTARSGYAVFWFSLQLNHIIGAGIFPLPSWNALHKEDSTVIKLPLVDLSPATLKNYRVSWWGIPGGAYIFFMIFGTNRDSFSEYTKLWTWFSTTVLRRPLPAKECSMYTLRSG
jgi:Pheromone A receptor